jgi:hypothetical protein
MDALRYFNIGRKIEYKGEIFIELGYLGKELFLAAKIDDALPATVYVIRQKLVDIDCGIKEKKK